MEKLRVFISGTQVDMEAERDAVSRAVVAVELATGIRAERTLSQLHSPREWIEEQIRDCNIFIGVYSHRYGWVIPEEEISATEFEFHLASKLRKPILVWIRTIQDKEALLSDFGRQQEFLNVVSDFSKGYFRQEFENPDELEGWVADALRETFIRIIKGNLASLSGSEIQEDWILPYLEEVAKQKPYSLWTDQTFIDRSVAQAGGLFTRTARSYRSELARTLRSYRAELAQPKRAETAPAVITMLGLSGERSILSFETPSTAVTEEAREANRISELLEQRPGELAFAHADMYDFFEKTRTLDEILQQEKRLMLLGEPGLGKTTSLLHFAWEVAIRSRDAFIRAKDESEDADPRETDDKIEIPIYVELKYYSGEDEIEVLLARRVNDTLRIRGSMLASDLNDSARVLRSSLAQSAYRFTLLLDGLNEVRPEFHTKIRGLLLAILNSPHRAIVSCREADYDQSLRERAEAFVLEGLQGDEIRDYLVRVLGKKGKTLFEHHIIRDAKMLSLTANPLMLWLISIVAQDNPDAKLPENRGKLFQQFFELMPRLRRSEGISDSVPLHVVTDTLAALAFKMQEHRQLSVDLRQASEWRLPTEGRTLGDVLVQAKEWRFVQADGRAGEPIEFLHQLFLEYFAATHISARLRRGRSCGQVLGRHFSLPDWEEVAVMLAGISEKATDLIKWLSLRVVTKREWRTALFVKRCWETGNAAQNKEALAAVIGALGAALQDKDERTRISIASALGNTHDPEAAKFLIALLKDFNRHVRIAATYSLIEIGVSATAQLIVSLRDENKYVCSGTSYALIQIGAPAIVRLISAILKEDAATLQSEISDTTSSKVPPSARQMFEPRYAERFIAAMNFEDNDVRAQAAYALGQIGDSLASNALIHALRDKHREVRMSAASALVRIGAPAVDLLIAAIRDTNIDVRRSAVEILLGSNDPFALEGIDIQLRIEAFIGMLRGEDETQSGRAVYALWRIGSPAVKPLIRLLGDPRLRVRRGAADTLGKLCDPSALPELERLSREGGPGVTYAARKAVKLIRCYLRGLEENN